MPGTIVRLERILRTLKLAVRFLARTPSFTVPAVASLALGIAANTTMFSVVNAVLLRPLGGEGDLVRIGRSVEGDRGFRSISYENFRYLREQVTTLSALAGFQIESVTLGGSDHTETISAELVTEDYFTVLGAAPRQGRGFTADEAGERAASSVVVVSDRFWRRRRGGSPDLLQRGLVLNDVRFVVVGIAPPGFGGSFPGVATDVWIPATLANLVVGGPAPLALPSLALLGKLKPGTAIEATEAELHGLAARLREDGALGADQGFSVAKARGVLPIFARVLRLFLALLMAAVAVVLLIACANVATLLLARASARSGEVAVRMALGASRGQVAAQLLAESFALAVLGGAAGLALTTWLIQLLNGWSPMAGPTGAPIYLGLVVDGRVLAFTGAVTILTTLVFGLAPAVQATRLDVVTGLKDPGARAGRRRSGLRGGLVVVQVGLSFVLLVAAALLFRSLRNSGSVELGFDPEQVVVVGFDLQRPRYPRERAAAFLTELLDRVRALAGVEHAALADFVPMVGGMGHPQPLSIHAWTPPGERADLTIRVGQVSDHWFSTVRQPILRGRDFVPAEGRPGPPRVAIVNEAMARRYWPGQDPIGQRFGLGEDLTAHEIVGVAGDARFGSFGGEIEPLVYVPALRGTRLHIRSSAPAAAVLSAVRQLVRELDPKVAPHLSGLAMREVMATSPTLVPVRIARIVFGVAGGIALVLAAGGLYGLVCYTLEQRLREIGIRVALGATRQRIFRLIIGGAARLTIVGIVSGALLAVAAMRLLAAMLYGLSPSDPLTFAAIAGLLGFVTLVAGYAGARRGLEADPMAVLRVE